MLDKLDESSNDSDFIWAVPNFRNKKKAYGDDKGNFNAGLMMVPRPLLSDYNKAIQILSAGYNDTEEKLFNEIFRNRWKRLGLTYNCQKRAFKLAPSVWNEIQAEGIKIIHYVGAKPWQTPDEIRRLDWEGVEDDSMQPYNILFELWRRIRSGDIEAIDDSLLSYVPFACDT